MILRFLTLNIAVVALSNLANLVNYLFQFMAARVLSPEEFGAMNAVYSLAVIIALFSSVAPYVIAKQIIELETSPESQDGFIRASFGVVCWGTALLAVALTLAAPSVAHLLSLPDSSLVHIMTALLCACMLFAHAVGTLQGRRRYLALASSSLAAAIGKFIFGILLIAGLGLSAAGAIWAGALSTLFAFAFAAVCVRKDYSPRFAAWLRPAFPPGALKNAILYAAPVSLMWLALLVMGNADIILVRHFCPSDETGVFSAAAVVARMGQFLPLALLGVLFPQVASEVQAGKSSTATVMTVMALTIALSGAFFAAAYLFPTVIINLLFGERYVGGAGVMVVVTGTMCLQAVIAVLSNYFIAKRNYAFLYPTFAVILLMLGFIWYNGRLDSMGIAIAMLIGTACVLTSQTLVLAIQWAVGAGRKALKR